MTAMHDDKNNEQISNAKANNSTNDKNKKNKRGRRTGF